MKKSPLKRKTPLRARGKSEVSVLKDEIQKLLRAIVIKKYGKCILTGIRPNHTNILQADHLITRSSSATYADSRLVVCVCSGCHLFKKWNKEEYDRLVKKILPKKIVKLWEDCDKARYRPTRKGSMDWKLAIMILKSELQKYESK